jgi:predicted transcriptional regulator
MRMTLEAFGARELDVLRVLWQRGPSTVAEVREALPAPLAYTTVLTVLRNLEAKAAVAHEEEGKAHRYFAQLAHAEAQHTAVGSLVERLFDGKFASLMTHLVDARGLSEEELRHLHALLGERLEGTADAADSSRDTIDTGDDERAKGEIQADGAP